MLNTPRRDKLWCIDWNGDAPGLNSRCLLILLLVSSIWQIFMPLVQQRCKCYSATTGINEQSLMIPSVIVFLHAALTEASYTILLTQDSPIFRVECSYSVGLTFLNPMSLAGALHTADQPLVSPNQLYKSVRSTQTLLKSVWIWQIWISVCISRIVSSVRRPRVSC